MNLDRLENMILFSEGVRKNSNGMHIPYLDSVGVWTIGYGTTKLFGEKVTEKTPLINDEKARLQFRHDIYVALREASEFMVGFWFTDAVRQEALIEMLYQLGGPRTRKFVNFRKAINERRWDDAALEMLYKDPEKGIHSAWYEQTTNRCKRLAAMIQSNVHPNRGKK